MNDDIIIINKPQKTKRKLPIILTIIGLLIIAIIAIPIIINSIIQSQKIKISDESSLLSDVPAETRNNFKDSLCLLLSNHFEGANCQNIHTNIRPESIQYSPADNADNISAINFLLDIDEHKQTYNVSLYWSDTTEIPEDVSIECPIRELMKYPETDCLGATTTSNSISIYLPHNSKLPSGTEYTIESGGAVEGEKELLVIVFNNCGDADIINEAINDTKKWLTSIDFDPNNYEYKTPLYYNHCQID